MHTLRPRIQRAFLKWLTEHKHAFKLRPTIVRRTDRSIELSFQGVTTQITAALTRWEINVEASQRGECWDIMICFEAIPKRVTDGYECRLCLPDAKTVYPSREALWREHLFGPFLEWSNEVLAHAHWLALHGTQGEMTYAKLIDDGDVDWKSGAFSLVKVRS